MTRLLFSFAAVVALAVLCACSSSPDATELSANEPVAMVEDTAEQPEVSETVPADTVVAGQADDAPDGASDREVQEMEVTAEQPGGTVPEPDETVVEAVAPEPAAAPAPEFSGTPAELTDAVHNASAGDVPTVLVDGPFEVGNRWTTETWANEADLSLGENGAICMRGSAGPRGKWVASLGQPLDADTYEALTVMVKAEGKVSVAGGVWTGPEQSPHLFESKAVAVLPGDWQKVRIPLKGGGFKSADSDWEFGARLADPDKIRRISLFVYADEPTPVCWRDVLLVQED